jgi:hypothetical protein
MTESVQVHAMKKGRTSSQEQIRIGCAGWSIPSVARSRFATAGTQLERGKSLAVAISTRRFIVPTRKKLGSAGQIDARRFPFLG